MPPNDVQPKDVFIVSIRYKPKHLGQVSDFVTKIFYLLFWDLDFLTIERTNGEYQKYSVISWIFNINNPFLVQITRIW